MNIAVPAPKFLPALVVPGRNEDSFHCANCGKQPDITQLGVRLSRARTCRLPSYTMADHHVADLATRCSCAGNLVHNVLLKTTVGELKLFTGIPEPDVVLHAALHPPRGHAFICTNCDVPLSQTGGVKLHGFISATARSFAQGSLLHAEVHLAAYCQNPHCGYTPIVRGSPGIVEI